MILLKLRQRRALTILEYSLLLACIVFALLAAQVYLKRALMFKWRESVDSFGHGRQYAPTGSDHPTTILNN